MNREQAKIYASLTREQVSKLNSEYGKLYDLICAYADGATVEMKLPSLGTWSEQTNPHFDAWSEYRVKPNDAEQPAEPWKPKDGEQYFYVSSLGIVKSLEYNGDRFCDFFVDFGNCFRTSEEAESALERVRASLKGQSQAATEKLVESLDGHELSDAEKGVIRILRRHKFDAGFGDFAFACDRKIIVCKSGTFFDFRNSVIAHEFYELATKIKIDKFEAKKLIEKGEPTW